MSSEELSVIAARIERALATVRGRAVSDGREVDIEVGIDGRITRLDVQTSLWNRDVAGCIAGAHARALADAQQIATEIRRELIEDPRVARLVEHASTQQFSPPPTPEPRYHHAPGSIYDRW